MASKSLVIYPGKLTTAETFRIGSIGDLNRKDFELLMKEVKNYLNNKKIQIPVSYEWFFLINITKFEYIYIILIL